MVSYFQNGPEIHNSSNWNGKTGSSLRKDFFLDSYIKLLNQFLIRFQKAYRPQNFNNENKKNIETQFFKVKKFAKFVHDSWNRNPNLIIESINIDDHFRNMTISNVTTTTNNMCKG